LLSAGDVLYLPKGWWHVVTPDNNVSLHIAFSITPRHGYHFLSWAIDEFRRDVELCRENLPPRFEIEAGSRFSARLGRKFESYLSDPEIMARFFRQYASMQPIRSGFSLPHTVSAHCHLLGDRNTVTWLATLADIEFEPERVTVTISRRTHTFSVQAEAILSLIQDGQPHSVGELVRRGIRSGASAAWTKDFLVDLVKKGLASLE
jgi:hypothetical protein